eukprot:gnl/MRDRNA2_/MRDRNA2_97653_c0_seq1.p1 gnl/MRDRNA2_/MRDRNA2_97653_c0~~gnl/MRDRNA2_/MRDRNA2_97653_c0_seq1.p1  ORF type:complete len:685 (+),score=148.37 gnl/MRDRNA2_/MRDRNA2_97653_c0_seq1:97-2151(+)
MADINNAEEEEKPMLTLEKGESVYSYAIFLPPIIYHQKGSLHNYEMCLGIILLILNLCMQVGLTYVVGQGVLVEGNAWRGSLVGMDVNDQIDEGQVQKDANQMALPAVGIEAWRSDPNYFGHVLEEAQAEFGLRQRKSSHLHHSAQLGLIQELKNEVDEEEEAVRAFKAGLRKFTGKSLRAGKSPKDKDLVAGHVQAPEAASPAKDKEEDAIHLAAGGKPMGGKGGAAAAAGGDDETASAKFCRMDNATYSCLPPSVRYASRWELLDTNGDGIWSREEAEKDEHNLEKKTKAKPFLVFRAITVGLVDRQAYDSRLWVEPNGMMAKMEGVPKAYFDYWMGDAALCSYADPGMCSTLLSRGFFNEAMNPAHPGKEIPDIDGALDYCTYMLKVGGGCDQSLPQIYKLYRAARHEQCGDGHFFAGGLHKNPYHETDRVYVIANVYANLQKFLKGDSATYKCFLFLVLLLWLYALTNEMREMIKLAEFTVVFPGVEGDLGLEIEKDEDGNEEYRIVGISREHRMVIAFMCATRMIVIVYLGAVGCVFLVNEVGYMDLLMNAVALAFILEIDEILYGAIARHSTIETLEALIDVEFETRLPTEDTMAGWLLQKDFWAIILFPIIAYLLILCQSLFVTKPILDALNCGCYQLGSQCRDAQYYNIDWWNNYWSSTLPNALTKIAEMKAAAGA